MEARTDHPKLNLSGFFYKKDANVATRQAFGEGLQHLGKSDTTGRLISCDAETSNSTMAKFFQKDFPDRFVECFIAEQNMCGVA